MSTSPVTNRRRFLLGLAATGAGGLLAACGGGSGSGSNSPGRQGSPTTAAAGDTKPGLGELQRAGPELALPAEFRYVVLEQSGNTMRDGVSTPFAFDGMASFEFPNGNVRLIRNHEIDVIPDGWALLGDEELAYDASAPGCTTSLEVRLTGGGEPVLVESFVSATGMLKNCAGGPTPWGSWLTCEETTEGRTRVDDGGGWDGAHGYVFEVSADGDQQQAAVPLPALGRFAHEAAAVDPGDGTVYLTEDNGYDSGFYRFLPDVAEDLARGGRLEMLAIVDQPEHDTAYGNEQGVTFDVEWVTIDDPDPDEADTDTSAVYNQGLAGGGARFKRLEGCWFDESDVWFTATEGGDAELGQVWRFDPGDQRLELVAQPTSMAEMLRPDNVTAAPTGGLIVCEDRYDGASHLLLVRRDGSVQPFAANIADDSEFAGACMSPDGTVLFVNTYGDSDDPAETPSRTLAIWGPWKRLT